MPDGADQIGAVHLQGFIGDLRRHLEPIDEDRVLRQARSRRDARRRRRRGLQGAGALAGAIVLVVAVVAGLSTRRHTSDVRVGNGSGPAVGVPGKWVGIPKAPIEPRRNAMSVWTGKEVLVFGGASKSASTQVICPFQPYGTALPCGKGLPAPELPRSAAAYDPATNSWRRIAPLPAGFTIVRFAASTSSQISCVLDGKLYVLAWKSQSPDLRRHLLRYDPATNKWATLGQINPKTMYGWALTAFDHKLIAYQGYVGPQAGIARAFDPKSGTWADVRLPIERQGTGGAVYASPLQMIGTRSSLFLFYLGEVPTSGGAASSSASAPSGQGATSFMERVARFDGRTWRQFTVTNRAWPQQGTWLRTGDHFTMLLRNRHVFGTS